MQAAEILERALHIISQPEAWCTNARGLNAKGYYVEGNDPSAVQRCALGALEAALGMPWERCHLLFDEPIKALDRAADILNSQEGRTSGYGWLFVDYNNSHTQEDVMILFKQAIALVDED